jgi:5'-nucleotidase (lipoprotein e(P4) family)
MAPASFIAGKRQLVLAFASLGLILGLAMAPQVLGMPAAEVESITQKLDQHKQVLTPIASAIKFSEGENYHQEFEEACKSGRAAVDEALAAGTGKSLAIVSDLDETLLDNRPFFETIKDQTEDQISWTAFEEWQKTCQAKPLKPTQELLAYARSRGVAIFFVTGRMERLRRVTIENLIKNGIAYDGMYMRKDGDEQNASTMKSAYRKQIEDMGFEIVLNIGDQYSDLWGGHSIDCEKLPNKIYFIR